MIQGKKKIIVTGGAGYIGSHVVVKLCLAGYEPVIVDNFHNSSPEVVAKLEMLTGTRVPVVSLDICCESGMASLFERELPYAVIHCAGLKAVAESVNDPMMYYDKNIGGTIQLLKQMDKVGCRRLAFSSSATVYGESGQVPFTEDSPTDPVNPYGRTKLFIEHIIRDWTVAGEDRSAVILRYFNPIGADESGLIGENPKGTPNNLMPLILDVAVGKRDELVVFGNDYETSDGTGVRDYIHVDDLARGHIAALEHTEAAVGTSMFNLGTGDQVSVLDLISTFERVTGQKVRFRIAGRRAGDVAISTADPSQAKDVLGWQTALDVDRMCADSWRFRSRHMADPADITN